VGQHNTAIQKDTSEIFETNSLAPINFALGQSIVPTVAVEARMEFYSRSTAGVIFTTPTQKDFYLKQLALNGHADGGGGSVQITFTTREGVAKDFSLTLRAGTLTDGATSTWVLDLPMRGLLLAKNSAITLVLNSGAVGDGVIVGYSGSDRSGL